MVYVYEKNGFLFVRKYQNFVVQTNFAFSTQFEVVKPNFFFDHTNWSRFGATS